MNIGEKKHISIIGIIITILLGIWIGTSMSKSDSNDSPVSSNETTSNGLPLFTKESLKEQMDFNFKETTWYPYISYYMVLNEERTIKIVLNKEKSNIPLDKAKSIAGAVAGLTYQQGRTNYFIYKVVDSKNAIVHTFDITAQNAELMGTALRKIINQADGVIRNIKPRDEQWNGINVIVSDAWYNAKDYEKDRFVESYGNQVGNIILKYTYVIGKDDIKVYFVDEYGSDVASPKLFGGYKINE